MTIAFLIILFKILVILVFVAIPFLFFSTERLNKLTRIDAKTTSFYRLYGVAMLALLIGYASAFPLLWQNIFPWAVVIMGIALALTVCAIFPQIAISPIF